MMASRIVLVCSFLLVFFYSCKENEKPANTPVNQRFTIEGTTEQVILNHQDGEKKLSLFVDEKTGKKVAEIEFHPNGQPKIDKRYVNDTLNGESWCYYPDGKPWSLNTFKDGLNHGPYKTWHENGQLYIDGHYNMGKEDGEWMTYYPTGQLNTRGLYKNGVKSGVWSSYNLEGTNKREQNFEEK
jgi:antitoxin component YwqK of YwqJK toxin-antitoxin module